MSCTEHVSVTWPGQGVDRCHHFFLVWSISWAKKALAAFKISFARVDALRDHSVDVGDRLLQAAAADLDDLLDVRAPGRFAPHRGHRGLGPAVGAEPIVNSQGDRLVAAERGVVGHSRRIDD
jgi:hypothetical protein